MDIIWETNHTRRRQNRDSRLVIFLKEPGQHNILIKDVVGETANVEETYPLITITDGARRYVTGYALRKGGAFHQKYYSNSKDIPPLLLIVRQKPC